MDTELHRRRAPGETCPTLPPGLRRSRVGTSKRPPEGNVLSYGHALHGSAWPHRFAAPTRRERQGPDPPPADHRLRPPKPHHASCGQPGQAPLSSGGHTARFLLVERTDRTQSLGGIQAASEDQIRYLFFGDPDLLEALGFGSAAWKIAPGIRSSAGLRNSAPGIFTFLSSTSPR